MPTLMPTRSSSGSYEWDLCSVLTSDDNMYESDDNMYDNDHNFEVDCEYSLYAQYNSESGQWEDGNWEFEGDEEDEGHDRGQGEHGDDDSGPCREPEAPWHLTSTKEEEDPWEAYEDEEDPWEAEEETQRQEGHDRGQGEHGDHLIYFEHGDHLIAANWSAHIRRRWHKILARAFHLLPPTPIAELRLISARIEDVNAICLVRAIARQEIARELRAIARQEEEEEEEAW